MSLLLAFQAPPPALTPLPGAQSFTYLVRLFPRPEGGYFAVPESQIRAQFDNNYPPHVNRAPLVYVALPTTPRVGEPVFAEIVIPVWPAKPPIAIGCLNTVATPIPITASPSWLPGLRPSVVSGEANTARSVVPAPAPITATASMPDWLPGLRQPVVAGTFTILPPVSTSLVNVLATLVAPQQSQQLPQQQTFNAVVLPLPVFSYRQNVDPVTPSRYPGDVFAKVVPFESPILGYTAEQVTWQPTISFTSSFCVVFVPAPVVPPAQQGGGGVGGGGASYWSYMQEVRKERCEEREPWEDDDECNDLENGWGDPWSLDQEDDYDADDHDVDDSGPAKEKPKAPQVGRPARRYRRAFVAKHQNKDYFKKIAAIANPLGGMDLMVPAVASYGVVRVGCKVCGSLVKHKHSEAIGGAILFGGIWWLSGAWEFLRPHKGAVRLGAGLALAEVVLKNYILPRHEPVEVPIEGDGDTEFIE